MRKSLVVVACSLALASCSSTSDSDDAADAGLDQAALEERVAGMYTPDDPDAEITADCEGGLDAEAGATQDCHLEVGEESADVRAAYTEEGDEDVNVEATPFVPADRVAETIKSSLADQGYKVDTVECEDELMGELDATVSCTATPAEGEGTVEVKVTSVDGLMVNFNYEVIS